MPYPNCRLKRLLPIANPVTSRVAAYGVASQPSTTRPAQAQIGAVPINARHGATQHSPRRPVQLGAVPDAYPNYQLSQSKQQRECCVNQSTSRDTPSSGYPPFATSSDTPSSGYPPSTFGISTFYRSFCDRSFCDVKRYAQQRLSPVNVREINVLSNASRRQEIRPQRYSIHRVVDNRITSSVRCSSGCYPNYQLNVGFTVKAAASIVAENTVRRFRWLVQSTALSVDVKS